MGLKTFWKALEVSFYWQILTEHRLSIQEVESRNYVTFLLILRIPKSAELFTALLVAFRSFVVFKQSSQIESSIENIGQRIPTLSILRCFKHWNFLSFYCSKNLEDIVIAVGWLCDLFHGLYRRSIDLLQSLKKIGINKG